MKKFPFYALIKNRIFFILSFILLFTSVAVNQDVKSLNVAIVKMQVSGGIPETYSLAFTDRLRFELFNTGAFTVMERSEMDEILKEQGFQMSGCTTDECFVEVGRILGVNHIVAGSVSKIGSLYTITLRLVSVETSKTVRAIAVDYKGEVEELASSKMQEAALKLAGQQDLEKPQTSSFSSDTQTIAGPLQRMTFVKIPAGSFIMGSNDGESDEKPVHTVNIKSFYMMTTEVTQAQWQSVMGKNPSKLKGDYFPVENVSWNDCQDFIQKLNQLKPGKDYRLPTEAEWEYACRAGTSTKFYSGNSDSDLERIGWKNGNSGNKTHPVGQKVPNAWGLYDMHGNVWEWCEDWYHDSYNGSPTNGSAWLSPSGQYRVLRGGSWHSNAQLCRSSDRGGVDPDYRDCNVGFRLSFSP